MFRSRPLSLSSNAFSPLQQSRIVIPSSRFVSTSLSLSSSSFLREQRRKCLTNRQIHISYSSLESNPKSNNKLFPHRSFSNSSPRSTSNGDPDSNPDPSSSQISQQQNSQISQQQNSQKPNKLSQPSSSSSSSSEKLLDYANDRNAIHRIDAQPDSSGLLRGQISSTATGLFRLVLPLRPATPASISGLGISALGTLTSGGDGGGGTSNSSSNDDGSEEQDVYKSRLEAERSGPTTTLKARAQRPNPNLNLSPTISKGETVQFLLHPRQPISFIASLIATETSASMAYGNRDGDISNGGDGGGRKLMPMDVTFHGYDGDRKDNYKEKDGNGVGELAQVDMRWSQATELSDFVQDAARDKFFFINIRSCPSDSSSSVEKAKEQQEPLRIIIRVPSFEERTLFLRSKLRKLSTRISKLQITKDECDGFALKGAKRFAISGFGALAGYWGLVYYLTFQTSLGWDVMEPVTYLTGLSTLMGGYLWFLYHQREISYRAMFEITSQRQRTFLYQQKGFDPERYQDLMDEAKDLRRAIYRVADDYDVEWSLRDEGKEHAQTDEAIDAQEIKAPSNAASSKTSGINKPSAPPNTQDEEDEAFIKGDTNLDGRISGRESGRGRDWEQKHQNVGR